MSRTETNTSPAPEPETEPRKGLDLSVTQVVGGALAAMTAAALGSRLSVAGTVVGAALASIIAAVAGALYTASLRHTRDKVRSVWTGTAGSTPTRVEVVSEEAASTRTEPPAMSSGRPTAHPELSGMRREPLDDPRTTVNERPGTKPSGGRLWKRIVIGALATFALAAGLITGLELVSGQALSGGSGTTFEQVREPRTGGADTDEKESSESPSSDSREESTEPSEEPSASTDPSTDPSPESSTASESASEDSVPSAEATDQPTTNAESAPADGGQAEGPAEAPRADGDGGAAAAE